MEGEPSGLVLTIKTNNPTGGLSCLKKDYRPGLPVG
jgi:hypothetical protein